MRRAALILVAVLLAGCAVHAPVPQAVDDAPNPAVTGTGDVSWERPGVGSIPAPPPPPPAPVAPPAEPHAAPPAPQAPAATGNVDQWVADVLNQAGVTPTIHIQWVGSPLQCGHVGGAFGCTQWLKGSDGKFYGATYIKVLASLAFTEHGRFVILHEEGHAHGIMNECAADQYAKAHGGDPAYATYC